MSKLQFFEMRAEQMTTMYDATFTKKDAQKAGANLVLTALEDGIVGKLELMANLVRLKEVIDTAVITMRDKLPFEKTEVLGVSFSPVDGGNIVNYSDDEIWAEHKRDLDARQDQLKLAQKQPTFDAYGNEVPKVSTTPRKSSITIKF